MTPKLSILIAAYNEEATIRPCVEAVLAAPACGLTREIIIVNDASTDGTGGIIEQLTKEHPEIRAFTQPVNQGKGAAIRRAIQEASGQIAIFQDADLEYNPRDYPKLLEPILDGRADAVYGSRFTGEVRRVLYFWHAAGNNLLTTLSNMLNDLNLTDMETCYKAFRLDFLKVIPLESNRFGIEPEITAKIAHNRWNIYEVPINYNGRTYEDGKKIGWRDGVAALWFIFKYGWTLNYAEAGRISLDALQSAPRVNAWIFSTIQPSLGNRIVELGSGIGNLTKSLNTTGASILISDVSENYLHQLRRRFGHSPRIKIAKLDLSRSEDYAAIESFRPDTVVCLNVLEHVKDDAGALKHLHQSVPDNCRLIFLVPRGQKLWSKLDIELGHVRRYESGELTAAMEAAGFLVEREFTFNRAGTIAWLVGNKICGQRRLKPWQVKIFNFLCPIFRGLEGILPWKGLSVICIARKAAAATAPVSEAKSSAPVATSAALQPAVSAQKQS